MIASIEETLTFLTQIAPPRNYKNIASLNQVVDFMTLPPLMDMMTIFRSDA